MSTALSDEGQRQRVVGLALVLLLMSVLIAATFTVLVPFIGIITYAVILATATDGPFRRLVGLFNGRRKLASIVFGAVAVAITVLPLFYLSIGLADVVRAAEQWLRTASVQGIPDLPTWIGGLPLVGAKMASAWQTLQSNGLYLLQEHTGELIATGRWLLEVSAGLAGAIIELLIGVIVATILLSSEGRVIPFIARFAARIAGPSGDKLLQAAARAIRGVAIGVIGTALIEFVLAWLGFYIAGVPGAIALAAITFIFAVIQLGPLFVWLPVAIWLGADGQVGWAIFLAAWGVIALMGTDNIVKPVLIARSGKLPLLVLFVGVIGGLAAWGFTGMFIGATVLAIMWTVTTDWLNMVGDPSAPGTRLTG